MNKIAVIGGTGVYDPEILENIRDVEGENEFGSFAYTTGLYQGREIIFMARHGVKHSLPPHLINYRANILALKKLGVKQIIATAAVGSINQQMLPGDFVLLDQFLDFTKNRFATFYEGGEAGVVHTDMTFPYCPQLRAVLAGSCRKQGISYHENGVYVCTEGPRFENAAEIKMYEILGGDLVGMTNVPEVVLAREAGICYGTIAMVTNFAAGISPHILTHEEVLQVMAENKAKLIAVLMDAIKTMPEFLSCQCSHQEKKMEELK